MKPTHGCNASHSSSCSSSFYKNPSGKLSLMDMPAYGSRISKLYLAVPKHKTGKHKLNKLICTRAFYDDIRKQLNCKSKENFSDVADLRILQVHGSHRNVSGLVNLVDKGAVSQISVSECCSCRICNCKTKPHCHAAGERQRYCQNSSRSSIISCHKKHTDDRCCKKHAGHKTKNIQSDPVLKQKMTCFKRREQIQKPCKKYYTKIEIKGGKIRNVYHEIEHGMGEAAKKSAMAIRQSKMKIEKMREAERQRKKNLAKRACDFVYDPEEFELGKCINKKKECLLKEKRHKKKRRVSCGAGPEMEDFEGIYNELLPCKAATGIQAKTKYLTTTTKTGSPRTKCKKLAYGCEKKQCVQKRRGAQCVSTETATIAGTKLIIASPDLQSTPAKRTGRRKMQCKYPEIRQIIEQELHRPHKTVKTGYDLKRCFCTLRIQPKPLRSNIKQTLPQTSGVKILQTLNGPKLISYESVPQTCIPGKYDPEDWCYRRKKHNQKYGNVGGYIAVVQHPAPRCKSTPTFKIKAKHRRICNKHSDINRGTINYNGETCQPVRIRQGTTAKEVFSIASNTPRIPGKITSANRDLRRCFCSLKLAKPHQNLISQTFLQSSCPSARDFPFILDHKETKRVNRTTQKKDNTKVLRSMEYKWPKYIIRNAKDASDVECNIDQQCGNVIDKSTEYKKLKVALKNHALRSQTYQHKCISSPCAPKKKDKNVFKNTSMNRCSCTIKLHKPAKKNKQTKAADCNVSMEQIPKKLIMVLKGTKKNKKQRFHKRKPYYEWEPFFFVPGECDPYEYLERVKMGKDCGVSLSNNKIKAISSLIGGSRCKVVNIQPRPLLKQRTCSTYRSPIPTGCKQTQAIKLAETAAVQKRDMAGRCSVAPVKDRPCQAPSNIMFKKTSETRPIKRCVCTLKLQNKKPYDRIYNICNTRPIQATVMPAQLFYENAKLTKPQMHGICRPNDSFSEFSTSNALSATRAQYFELMSLSRDKSIENNLARELKTPTKPNKRPVVIVNDILFKNKYSTSTRPMMHKRRNSIATTGASSVQRRLKNKVIQDKTVKNRHRKSQSVTILHHKSSSISKLLQKKDAPITTNHLNNYKEYMINKSKKNPLKNKIVKNFNIHYVNTPEREPDIIYVPSQCDPKQHLETGHNIFNNTILYINKEIRRTNPWQKSTSSMTASTNKRLKENNAPHQNAQIYQSVYSHKPVITSNVQGLSNQSTRIRSSLNYKMEVIEENNPAVDELNMCTTPHTLKKRQNVTKKSVQSFDTSQYFDKKVRSYTKCNRQNSEASTVTQNQTSKPISLLKRYFCAAIFNKRYKSYNISKETGQFSTSFIEKCLQAFKSLTSVKHLPQEVSEAAATVANNKNVGKTSRTDTFKNKSQDKSLNLKKYIHEEQDKNIALLEPNANASKNSHPHRFYQIYCREKEVKNKKRSKTAISNVSGNDIKTKSRSQSQTHNEASKTKLSMKISGSRVGKMLKQCFFTLSFQNEKKTSIRTKNHERYSECNKSSSLISPYFNPSKKKTTLLRELNYCKKGQKLSNYESNRNTRGSNNCDRLTKTWIQTKSVTANNEFKFDSKICTPDEYKSAKLHKQGLEKSRGEYNNSSIITKDKLHKQTTKNSTRTKPNHEQNFQYLKKKNNKYNINHDIRMNCNHLIQFNPDYPKNNLFDVAESHESSNNTRKRVRTLSSKKAKEINCQYDDKKSELKRSGVAPFLKQCFCKIKYQDDDKLQIKHNKNTHINKCKETLRDLPIATKASRETGANILYYNRVKMKTSKSAINFLKPYEYQTYTCVPKNCNPLDRYGRNKQLNLRAPSQKLIATTRKRSLNNMEKQCIITEKPTIERFRDTKSNQRIVKKTIKKPSRRHKRFGNSISYEIQNRSLLHFGSAVKFNTDVSKDSYLSHYHHVPFDHASRGDTATLTTDQGSSLTRLSCLKQHQAQQLKKYNRGSRMGPFLKKCFYSLTPLKVAKLNKSPSLNTYSKSYARLQSHEYKTKSTNQILDLYSMPMNAAQYPPAKYFIGQCDQYKCMEKTQRRKRKLCSKTSMSSLTSLTVQGHRPMGIKKNIPKIVENNSYLDIDKDVTKHHYSNRNDLHTHTLFKRGNMPTNEVDQNNKITENGLKGYICSAGLNSTVKKEFEKQIKVGRVDDIIKVSPYKPREYCLQYLFNTHRFPGYKNVNKKLAKSTKCKNTQYKTHRNKSKSRIKGIKTKNGYNNPNYLREETMETILAYTPRTNNKHTSKTAPTRPVKTQITGQTTTTYGKPYCNENTPKLENNVIYFPEQMNIKSKRKALKEKLKHSKSARNSDMPHSDLKTSESLKGTTGYYHTANIGRCVNDKAFSLQSGDGANTIFVVRNKKLMNPCKVPVKNKTVKFERAPEEKKEKRCDIKAKATEKVTASTNSKSKCAAKSIKFSLFKNYSVPENGHANIQRHNKRMTTIQMMGNKFRVDDLVGTRGRRRAQQNIKNCRIEDTKPKVCEELGQRRAQEKTKNCRIEDTKPKVCEELGQRRAQENTKNCRIEDTKAKVCEDKKISTVQNAKFKKKLMRRKKGQICNEEKINRVQKAKCTRKLMRRKEPYDFQCSLYMASLRKRPFLSVYYQCPWFYPHCINLLNVWRKFTDVVLFFLAAVVWSPCIFLTETLRALICCTGCNP